MAGESPDKSEQRKSSGETAPGERDPRLAVFRESAERPEPEDRGRVDQPTAVFKMPPPEQSPPASETPEAAETPETAEIPETPEAAETPERDARLRAAVAAWVATAETPADAEAAAAEDRTDAADASTAGREGSRAADAAEASSSAATDGDEPPAGEAAAALSADADRAAAPANDEAGGEATSDGDAAAARQPEVDADAPGAGRAAKADGDEPSAAEAEASTRADADASGTGRAAGSQPGAGGSWTGRDVGPAAVAAEAQGGPRESAAADVNANANANASGETARALREGGRAGGEASVDASDGGEDTPTAAATPAGGDESPGDGPGAGRGVDQATAVFKAVRPRQAVDQPTTALKAVGKPGTTESAAERTSQFVPLKRDDVRPPAARPSRAPAAPPAGPAPSGPAPASAPVPEAERTRQQPLPPRPPLDLLAELTNTPPPPETPVRTAVRRVKIWTPLVLLLLIVFAVAQFLRPLPSPTLALTAKPTYTFEGDAISMPWPEGGQSAVEVQGVGSIGTHGEQKPSPIASVAKAMTAYVILKEHPLKGDETGPKITVDEQAERESKLPDESTAAIREGQQFTERQMLQLLMIPSGNNAARLLARWGAKSQDEFVTKMNDAAKDLGMKNTTYTDPSGLEASTVSTAVDQLKLAKAVMENDVFREIVNMPQAEIPGIEGKIYNNNNILLQPGVSGIKTGSSTPAGGNLLWTADTVIDGKERRIVGAVMGQQDATTPDSKLQLAITRSLKLIQAAQRDVTSATVVKKGQVVGYVDDGLGGQTPVVATKDLKAVGWPGLKVELAISDAGKPLPHAAKAGDEVGQVTVGSGPGQVKAPVALQKDVVEPGFGDRLTRVG
ncbi:D-alanyl-D-alanine carboxypeptidase [Streptomyces sp. ISL-96]|uniref:D-alanyl-D-alanine carboxypeptidase n=1 Tax=Streptomyces sp. ISL-96 TaxID=2819191 RepID=UPI001BEA84D6|nr:D-alanyl-D-alanine carboxypeptidase [Streptomyces sp. ISL-96]MBT2489093.1 D-alanyl-D-alanine carboxypeptidase [Streptomyces sp. ISL-96]